MNKEIFNSMQKQMKPSSEVREALSERLTQPTKKRPVPWAKYGTVAACAALVIGGFSVYSLRQNPTAWMLLTRNFHHDAQVQNLHSYVVVEGLENIVTEDAIATNEVGGGTETGGGGTGDQDMEMTVYDLEEVMLEVGFTEEEVKEYETIGYQMTWAKWWKFVNQQRDSEGDDPFNLDDLKAFSQKELFINTGVLPGGAYIGDAPSQEEAINAYQKLMDHFNGNYPDWYGGAYIDRSATLVVQLVSSEDPGDKTLELQVLDWTDDGRVAFSSAKYSLRYLHDLQDKVVDVMLEQGLFAGCGTDEEANRLDLTLASVTDEALALLARLDPDDDAIYVQVGQRISLTDGEDVRTDSATLEDPAAHYAMPGGVTPPVPEDDADLIADEPWVEDLDGVHYGVDELPEQKQPAVVQSIPEEDVSFTPERPVQGDSSGYTLAYDPAVGFIYPKT